MHKIRLMLTDISQLFKMMKKHIHIELFVPFCNNIWFSTQLKWPKGVTLAGKFKGLDSVLNIKFFWKV